MAFRIARKLATKPWHSVSLASTCYEDITACSAKRKRERPRPRKGNRDALWRPMEVDAVDISMAHARPLPGTYMPL
jgi:hypothetical protein